MDSGAAVARRVCSYLRESGQGAAESRTGSCRWYVSDSTEGFAGLASRFLGRPVTEPVEQVSVKPTERRENKGQINALGKGSGKRNEKGRNDFHQGIAEI